MKEEKILWECFGGLGDCLQYSTLPEMFSKEGYDVYIKSDNPYRNSEIRELIWEKNPFVKGFKNSNGNCGSTLNYQNYVNDFIKNIEIGHGLKPTNSFPKIYININENTFYNNKIFIDSNYISPSVNNEAFYSIIKNIHEKYLDKELFIIKFKNNIGPAKKVNLEEKFATYEVESIFQYCELIKNCFALICHFSGSAVLAATIKNSNNNPLIYTTHNNQIFNSVVIPKKLYFFENINYITYNL